ncbi:MAG: hypothetical protein PGN24_11240 [Microbacterium arborescens]
MPHTPGDAHDPGRPRGGDAGTPTRPARDVDDPGGGDSPGLSPPPAGPLIAGRIDVYA